LLAVFYVFEFVFSSVMTRNLRTFLRASAISFYFIDILLLSLFDTLLLFNYLGLLCGFEEIYLFIYAAK